MVLRAMESKIQNAYYKMLNIKLLFNSQLLLDYKREMFRWVMLSRGKFPHHKWNCALCSELC